MAVRDPFLAKRRLGPEEIIRSEPAQVEKAWSDAARAAAAAARSHGYASHEGSGEPGDPKEFMHPEGHHLAVHPAGNWTHSAAPHSHAVMVDGGFHDSYPNKESALEAASNMRDKGDKATVQRIPRDMRGEPVATEGNSLRALKTHLSDLHGPPHVMGSGPNVVTGRFGTEKQAPPGPRVVEVDEDQDSVARDYELLRPGQVTDAPEAGGELLKPVGKSSGPRVVR